MARERGRDLPGVSAGRGALQVPGQWLRAKTPDVPSRQQPAAASAGSRSRQSSLQRPRSRRIHRCRRARSSLMRPASQICAAASSQPLRSLRIRLLILLLLAWRRQRRRRSQRHTQRRRHGSSHRSDGSRFGDHDCRGGRGCRGCWRGSERDIRVVARGLARVLRSIERGGVLRRRRERRDNLGASSLRGIQFTSYGDSLLSLLLLLLLSLLFLGFLFRILRIIGFHRRGHAPRPLSLPFLLVHREQPLVVL